MTADYVAFHAAERPDAVAVIHNGRAVGYAAFSRDIRSMARGLLALGLSRGRSIAVGAEDLYLHWLLLLAAERLGIAAMSFSGSAEERGAPLGSVDLVLAEPQFTAAGEGHHPLAREWIEAVLARSEEGEPRLPAKEPDDPVRIVGTSGTTAASKRFLVLRRMHDALSAQWIWGFGLTRRCRYLMSVPFTVRATYDFGSACLRMGGTLVLDSRRRPVEVLSAEAITHVILMPIHLKAVLDGLPPGEPKASPRPPDFVKPRDLTVLSFGAGVSRTLRERAMARLATALCDLYGTVEVAAVSTIWSADAEGFGTVWPRVQVEAVDERGNPVPAGEIGQIRVKTDCMSEGYLDGPEATRRMFRDGWFHPGDMGVLAPGRRLKILGRVDDLLNLGGYKCMPTSVEERLLDCAAADDVAVSSIPNAEGIDELCVAVSDARHGDEEIERRIMDALSFTQFGHFYIVKLDRIPRNANGKIERKILKEMMARVLGAPA